MVQVRSESGSGGTPGGQFFEGTWSYWSSSVPSDTHYTPFQVTGDSSPGFHSDFGVYMDVSYQVNCHNSDPLVDVIQAGSWDNRSSGTQKVGSFHIPQNFILPDATDDDTPNFPAIFANLDTGEDLYLNAACRPVAGGPLYGYLALPDATHGGSGTIGGEITAADLGANVLDHALAIEVWGAKYLSQSNGGYIAPATHADDGFNDPNSGNFYGGNIDALKIGARLAIPPSVTPESIGVTSPLGLVLFNGLVKFGAYIVDNTAWDAISLCCTADVEDQLMAIKSEIDNMFAALQIIGQGYGRRKGQGLPGVRKNPNMPKAMLAELSKKNA